MKTIEKKIILILSLVLTLFIISISGISGASTTIGASDDLNNTIINSNNGDTINLNQGTYAKNVTGIKIDKNLTIIGKDAKNTIIDGNMSQIFTITKGNSLTLINITLTNAFADDGAAIYNDEGTLTVRDSIFIKNNAMHYGGAIYNNNGNLNVINSTFTNNEASSGGGAIANNLGSGETIYQNISNSTFTNNNASIGGAIYNSEDNIMNIINCIFVNNSAFSNGGAINNNADNFTINNSTFINNKADYTGGAVSNSGSFVKITNSIFKNNSVLIDDFNGGGGAISNEFGENIIIHNSVFMNNSANNTIGGAVYNNDVENLNITNCNFTGNIAKDGGAIYNTFANNVNIVSCNIINNSHGITIDEDSNDNIINYNRIFNNTHYGLNNSGINTNADFNWWGSNNPDMREIIGVNLNNYFVMDITNITSLKSNGTVTFKYTFKLNTDELFDSSLLPYFVTDVYTSFTNGVVKSFDARFDNTFDITVKRSGEILYTFVTDNEIKTLNGEATIPPTPKPIPKPVPTPNQKPSINETEDNNNTMTPNANATMKKTGIPIIAILLILLTSLNFIIRKNN